MDSMVVRKMLILVALAALLLTRCGKEEQQTPVGNLEPVTLRLGIPYQFSGDDSLLDEAIETFQQENSHITVETVSAYSFDRGVIEDLQVDAVVWLPDPTLIGGEQSAVLSLEPFLSEIVEFDEGDFFPGLLDAFRWRGDLYGLPAYLGMSVMYYNRDMFDAQGVAYPRAGWTWQDFFDSAQQLTTIEEGGGEQTGHWGFVSHPAFGDLIPFILQHGGAVYDDPLEPTRPVCDDPLTAEAIQWYADLGLVHGVMPIVQQDKVDELSRFPTDAFALQQAAMVMGGIGARGGDIIPWNFGWGVAPLPRDQTGGAWMVLRGYFIAARTDHPWQAWALVRSLTESEPSLLPARRSVAESETFRQRVGTELADAALYTLDNDDLLLLFTGLRSFGWYEHFTAQAYWVVIGDDTAEEMMTKLRGQCMTWSFVDP
jgi:ABC-type glycerol-3-phosphate transport system substrate-binding protein